MLNGVGDQGLGNAQLWWPRVGGMNCCDPSTVALSFKTTLLNTVDVEIKLMHSRNSFCCVSSLAAGAWKTVITYSLVSVKKSQAVPGTLILTGIQIVPHRIIES